MGVNGCKWVPPAAARVNLVLQRLPGMNIAPWLIALLSRVHLIYILRNYLFPIVYLTLILFVVIS